MDRAAVEAERGRHEEQTQRRLRRSLGAPEAVLAVTAVTDAVLALGAFVLSFDALRELAVVAGVRPALAWIWPVIVDGFIVVATINAIVLSKRSAKSAWYPWAALLVFALVSVIGNGLHAARHANTELISVEIAAAVSAVPAVALLVISHLIVVMLMAHRNAPTSHEPQRDDSIVVEALEPNATAERPRPLPTTRSQNRSPRPLIDDQALVAWVRSEIAQGRRIAGSDLGRYLGLSPATGRRRLSALRDRHPDLAELMSR